MPLGLTFLAEEVSLQLANEGLTTPTGRSMGPVIRHLARVRAIRKTGQYRPSRSSNLSPMIEWERS
jgi:hypothetical protein